MNMTTLNEGPCAISWASIVGGAVVASAVSLALLVLGSGLGWATVSPWSGFDFSITEFTITAAIWLIVMQWLSSAFGGYMAGRLRGRWSNIKADEVMFRDTAHGLMAWALATILVAGFLTSTMSTGIKTGSEVAAHTESQADENDNDMFAYPIDTLFRTSGKTRVPDDVKNETTRIVVRGTTNQVFTDVDKNYLADLVVANTDLTRDQAVQRVDGLLFEIDAMKVTADKARKAASTFAILTFLSMLIGAFVASAAGAIGGRHRDEYSL